MQGVHAVHGVGNTPALADGDEVTLLGAEARGDVGGDVGVSLFKPLVFFDVMQIIPTDNDGAVHLGALHDACKVGG